MKRRDVVVDLAAPPRTLLDVTAQALFALLSGSSGMPVLVGDVDRYIVAAGGSVIYRPDAVKALRNQGILVDVTKARHLSTYTLDPGSADVVETHRHRIDDAYSEWVTRGRSLAGAVAAAPADVLLAAEYAGVEMTCVSLGRTLGKPLPEIAADLVPL